MTAAELKARFPHMSEDTLRKSASDYGQTFSNDLGSVVPSKPQRNAIPSLDGAVKAKRRRKGRVVVCVSLINFRRRELDSDNLQTALKPVRDAVASSLGVDDRDARVRWQYGQVQSNGRTGILVRIEEV